jgi:raffinose/stachyose/melibiose transport system permease protein
MGLLRYTWRSFARELLVLLIAAIFCVPLYIVIVLSLKSNSDIFAHPLSLPTHPQTSNFSTAWSQTNGGVTISHAMVNNVIITVGTVLLTIVVSGLCAYTLARRHSKLSTGLYMLFVLGLIVPYQLGVVPLYVLLRHLHLIGTYLGIILLQTGLYTPLAVFLYTGFIRALPKEYEEAAEVDGASFLRTLFRVILPMLWPVTGTIAILVAVFTWNEFFLSIIFLGGTSKEPLSVAIYSFVGGFSAQWNDIFAAVLISIAPILVFYIFAQKQLVKGIAGGGVRG